MSLYTEGPTYGLRDRQRDPAVRICPECGGELFHGGRIYRVEGLGWVCRECFGDWVRELLDVSPALLARRLGVEEEWV